MQTTVTNGEITTVFDVAEFNVNVGESARIDVNEAVNYIKTGQAEVQETVDEGIADFNQNAVEKTAEFNSNATNKNTAFNENASAKTADFNSNANSKTGDFNTNASSKTGDFNDNATSKTNTFNQNATDKTTAFNNNASEKTTAFNDNYTAKKAIIDGQVDLAKDWATKTDGKVDGEDYSAKYYAQSILPIASDITTVAGIASDVTTVSSISSDVTSVAGNATDISTVADNISDVNSVATDILKVTAVADDLTNIDAVNANKTNIDAVAGNNSNITAVANNATNINAVAGNESNINAVNANKTNIDTVASISSDVTTVSGISSDVTSVASNNTDISAVADDLTNIDAVNSNKTNIDAVAGDLTNINAVAGDLTNINNASTYADNANIWAEGSDAQVQALGGVHSSKGWAEVSSQGQVQSNWAETDTTAKSYIQNKPTLGTMASESASDYTKTSGLATVATSGNYNDLSNKPTIPTVTDTYSATSSDGMSGKAVASAISGKANDSDVVKLTGNQTIAGEKTFNTNVNIAGEAVVGINGDATHFLEVRGKISDSTAQAYVLLHIPNIIYSRIKIQGDTQGVQVRTGDDSNYDSLYYKTESSSDNSNKGATTAYVQANLANYQPLLTSGTNIKTINGNSVLGSGDLTVGGSWGSITGTLSNQTDLNNALSGKVNTSDLATCHVVVDTYSNGTSWYRVYDDGWCEQGGFVDNNTAIKTITLLKPYANTSYSIQCTSYYDVSEATLYQPHTYNKSTSSFQCASYGERGGATNASGMPVIWQTSGYII